MKKLFLASSFADVEEYFPELAEEELKKEKHILVHKQVQ